jgi:hypothetical protein
VGTEADRNQKNLGHENIGRKEKMIAYEMTTKGFIQKGKRQIKYILI